MVWLRGLTRLSPFRNRLMMQVQVSPRTFRSSSTESSNYSAEQQQMILNRLNDTSSVDSLPKRVAQAVRDRLREKGPFNNLEELLELPKVGPKSIRTVCEKILNRPSDVEETSSGRAMKKRKPVFSVPALRLDKKINSVVSVFVETGAVSWAKLNIESKTVVDWELQTYETESLDLAFLLQQAVSIEKFLPEGDLYVLEENNKTSFGKGNSRTLSLTCMLSTVLHLKRDSENNGRLVFIKSRLVDRHYNAVVGNETVSLQPIVEDMIQGLDDPYDRRYSRFHIGPPIAAYMKKKGPYQKELLCRAALIGICLADLTLLRETKQ